jgi:hypothetical protein
MDLSQLFLNMSSRSSDMTSELTSDKFPEMIPELSSNNLELSFCYFSFMHSKLPSAVSWFAEVGVGVSATVYKAINLPIGPMAVAFKAIDLD